MLLHFYLLTANKDFQLKCHLDDDPILLQKINIPQLEAPEAGQTHLLQPLRVHVVFSSFQVQIYKPLNKDKPVILEIWKK